jgi:acyl-coenzyme A thioesterase PaaI-like protein
VAATPVGDAVQLAMNALPLRGDTAMAEAPIQWTDDGLPHTPRTAGGVALCFACRAAGRCRMGLERETITGDATVVSEITCSRDNEGGPNVAHGGWTAGVLDELVGHAVVLRNEFVVTGTLKIVFVRPTPVEVPLIGRSTIVRREGRKVFVTAQIELASNGAVISLAEAILVKRGPEHFSLHEKWLLEQLKEPDGAP